MSADRRDARWKFHRLARSPEQRGGLLARDHETAKPEQDPMTGVVVRGAQLVGGSEHIGGTPRHALAIGGQRETSVAILETQSSLLGSPLNVDPRIVPLQFGACALYCEQRTCRHAGEIGAGFVPINFD